MMQTLWTREQILGLAPDHHTLKSARNIAHLEKWARLGCVAGLLWGEFASPRGRMTYTTVNLTERTFTCTSRVKSLPSRFVIALLLLWESDPAIFAERAAPTWLEEQGDNGRSTPTFQPTGHDQQLVRLRSGMQELSLWLQDMVHQGFATLPQKPKTYWETMSHRLVDSQAPRLANTLKQLSTLPKQATTVNWPTELLQQCGRLYLYTQAWKQYDHLTPAEQNDLKQYAGWVTNLSPPSATLSDRWRIIGRQYEPQERGNLRHTWLWGEKSERFIQLSDSLRSASAPQPLWPTDSQLQATAHLVPSSTPFLATLSAIEIEDRPQADLDFSPPETVSWESAHAELSAQLAKNPWQTRHPVVLGQIHIEREGSSWLLRDGGGHTLFLQEKVRVGWHLLALSAQAPLTLFGVWNGRSFDPLSYQQNGRWLDCHTLGALT